MDSIADAALSGIGIVVFNFCLVLGAEKIRWIYAKFKQNKRRAERGNWS
jgi:hypothetical protein